jgi:hypothetical protein
MAQASEESLSHDKMESMAILTHNPRLFVDLRDVEARENIIRTFHSADKYGRVLV